LWCGRVKPRFGHLPGAETVARHLHVYFDNLPPGFVPGS
jgi:hypothetical protein